ncbi:ABC transporter ATP-binding protein [Natronohydrobacter thiooxidans]|uniref:ABC transporter ATP-binding protein n=1 Tax=Natronohydrobacter thiooxidans TaxID=87172 RepID=UPI0008FF622F|nr:ATP-binding cassette domain-containing protein [Natronohydrobacter thiooxidans]
MTLPLLSVTGLSVAYGSTEVLRDISFDLMPGQALGILGLSGCGKTTLLRALLGMLPPSAKVRGQMRTGSGAIALSNRAALRARLGREIGFVAQNPFDACAPLRTVRAHVEEAWRAHGLRPDAARIAALCAQLGLDPAMLDHYPHEWSGGMLQRANIAAAVALAPPVVLADEPTSAVDADTAAAVMDCLRAGAPGTVIVSHDLPLVARYADQVLLIEEGRITARAPRTAFAAGRLPAPLQDFRESGTLPPARPSGTDVVLQATDLVLVRGGRQLAPPLSFSLRAGEIFGVAGRSGLGKSTLLAVLAGHLPAARGTVLRDGVARAPRNGEVLTLFQDALSSMNPRWPLSRIVAEPVTTGPLRVPPVSQTAAACMALAEFGLSHIRPDARPGTLSTGQGQRVTLARASLAAPRLVLADEPTSALDPQQKARALAGLSHLARKGAAIVFVSHDTTLLDAVCNRVMQMQPLGCGRSKQERGLIA